MNKIIIANQKNVLTYHEVIEFLNHIRGKIPKEKVIFCPSYPYLLDYVREGYLVGSQDVSETDQTVTGEVNENILSSLSIRYSLVGHIERRVHKNETDESIIQKIKKLVKNNICPLLCIGEMDGENFEDVLQRLKKIFDSLTLKEQQNIIICYEPMDAVGTNKEIVPEERELKLKKIKELILTEYHINTKVLCGGSVDSENVKDLLNLPELDGVFVGSSSMESNEFLKIIEVAVTM